MTLPDVGTPATQPRSGPPRPAARTVRPGRRVSVAYLFLTPWMAGALLLTIGPMLVSLYLSFTDYDLFTSPRWVGLANYRRLLTDDPQFLDAVKVTVRYVLIATPLKLAVALGVAMLLNRPRRGQGFYRAAFYAPSLLGTSVSLALVWQALFTGKGPVDRLLAGAGVHTGGWIDQPRYALYTLVVLGVWQFGAPMVIFLAGLKQIPADLYEAAAIDGAGPWKRFKSVTLPMLSPVILFNLVLETIHAFQVFTSAFIISNGRGGPSNATLFYTLYLFQRGFVDYRMGYATAMAWLMLVTLAVVTAVIFRTARLWVFYAGEEDR